MQGKPYRVVKTAKGLDIPYGSEYVLEGRMLARQREIEGPFGEFPGFYSGGHRYPVIEVDRVSHRKNPIFEAVYVGSFAHPAARCSHSGPFSRLNRLSKSISSHKSAEALRQDARTRRA